jgi:hypothetical protein
MQVNSPAWIIAAGIFIAHASGVIDIVGKTLSGVDQTANAVIDFRKIVPQIGTYIHANNSTGSVLRKAQRTNRSTVARRKFQSFARRGNSAGSRNKEALAGTQR